MSDTLGDRIRRLRVSRGWSQQRLAEIAGPGVDQTMISRIESRPEYEPGVHTVARIARALAVPVESLLSLEAAPRLASPTFDDHVAEIRRRLDALEALRPAEGRPARRKRKPRST